MDQSQILEQVSQARERVAQSVAQIETTREELQALLSQTGERVSELQESFNDFQSHLQTEVQRARTAMEALGDLIGEQENWLNHSNDEIDTAAGALSQNLTSSGTDSDSASEQLRTNLETVQTRGQSIETLYGEVEQQAQERHQAHSQAMQAMTETTGQWTEKTKADEAEERKRVQDLLDGPLKEGQESFAERLRVAVEAARQALDANKQDVQTCAEKEVDQLTTGENSNRKQVTGDLEAMSKALADLGDLVSMTSDTMIKGADQATDLMQVTGMGVNTVIGLIDNLKQIFDEIESAWS